MEPTKPRVLMASRRLVDPNVWCASTYELEDILCDIAGVEIASVAAIEPQPFPLEQKILGRLQEYTGISVKREPRWQKLKVEKEYDLFLVRVMTPDELDFIEALDGWRERCSIAVCWIEELWLNWLQYEHLLKPLRKFDHVFVEQALTVEALSKILDRPCSFVAPAIDALRFCPYPDPPERSIDLYAMGRRGPATHAAAIEHARKKPGFMYLYDSVLPGTFVDSATEHRELTANLIQRSRYFIANRAKADMPDQNENQQEYGPRFFEGAGAGAVLIGEPPKCQAFDEAFDWADAIIPLEFDSTDIVALIQELDHQPERIAKAREANVVNTLRRHDWVHRWLHILRTLGLPTTEGARERCAELESRAAAIDSRGPVEEDGVQYQ